MRIVPTIVILSLAILLLMTAGIFIQEITLPLHPDSFVDHLIKYQIVALITSVLTMSLFLHLNPASCQFLSPGDFSVIAEKERWLGIDGRSSWGKNGLQLLLFISMATGIFMFLGVMHTGSLNNFHAWFIPFILLFSLTNSFSEEMIFRFGVIAGLNPYYSKNVVIVVSALLFGLPHYFGNPGGAVGVIMSGMLGYILCKATLESKGISIAWFIHFIQDLIIFTAIMMMSIKQ